MGGMSRSYARALRKNLTDAERKLWESLRLRQVGGYKFRRQQPLGPYIVDFICFEKKLIVEVDGGQHADEVLDDLKRTEWLMSQGFSVLRFWNHDVLQQTEDVLEMIGKSLGREEVFSCPPTLALPHKGGGD